MKLEFRVVMRHYGQTLFKEDKLSIWGLAAGISLLVAICVYFSVLENKMLETYRMFLDVANLVLSILIGFTIGAISILLASDSKSIKDLKEKFSKYKVDGKSASYFKLLLIYLSFTAIFEILSLILQIFLTSFFFYLECIGMFSFAVIIFFNMFFLMAVLMLNLSAVAKTYLTYFNEDQSIG